MDDVKVSVLCMAYNHGNYIRQCLEGFVNQKTNFKFQVFINDDCSTDNTAEIIREYEKKYPNIIKPIYQKENQYSKDVGIMTEILVPLVDTKYLAICEGDDCWIDNEKLQIQYDYMESHPECYLYEHAFISHEVSNGKEEPIILCEERDLSLKEIVDKNPIGTATMFMRTEVKKTMPESFVVNGFGDIQMPIYAAMLGKVHYSNRIMSIYNAHVPGSWTSRFRMGDRNKNALIHAKEVLTLLENASKIYDGKFSSCFTDKIEFQKLEILFAEERFKEIKKNNFYRSNKNLFNKYFKITVSIGAISKPLLHFILKIRRSNNK